MDFKTLSRLSTLLSKNFAEELLRLLVSYKTISASEAASRLDLHIKTAQDFLDELTALNIAGKEEVFERKRPYFRYTLKNPKLNIEFDLCSLYDASDEDFRLKQRIREKLNSGAIFTTSGSNDFISSVTVFTGKGRQRKERKLSLTISQGKFLYHLPFPTADYLSIQQIIKKAGLDSSFNAEIFDIVEVLKEFDIIDY